MPPKVRKSHISLLRNYSCFWQSPAFSRSLCGFDRFHGFRATFVSFIRCLSPFLLRWVRISQKFDDLLFSWSFYLVAHTEIGQKNNSQGMTFCFFRKINAQAGMASLESQIDETTLIWWFFCFFFHDLCHRALGLPKLLSMPLWVLFPSTTKILASATKNLTRRFNEIEQTWHSRSWSANENGNWTNPTREEKKEQGTGIVKKTRSVEPGTREPEDKIDRNEIDHSSLVQGNAGGGGVSRVSV